MQASDAKKEEFQRYLEKAGVLDNITKVLVGLYELPEKPVNANDFVKEYLGAPVREDTERLKKVVEEQQRLLRERDEEIAQLKQQIAALQANSGAI